jgi:hypothetical protein
MSATAIPPVDRGMLTQGFAELTIEVRDPGLWLSGGLLEGNVVEVWDFFERGEGRRDGAAALAGGDAVENDPSS